MLSRTEKRNLQRQLTALGFDTKGIDGRIGSDSLRAIRAWQTANDVIADGYVEKALYQRIMDP
ncbi:MAG: peptidoglycan-binding protein [Hyphomonadaceae bacterium]|nr:peptidoglycan-binding protein [Hyphomonadaceae bacterium]